VSLLYAFTFEIVKGKSTVRSGTPAKQRGSAPTTR